MDTHFYNVNVSWNHDRLGIMCSPELNRDSDSCIEVATPPEFPKGIPGIWSPEHLFTAAVSSCLMTTFLAIAENSGLDFIDFSCSSKGKLEKVDGQLIMSEVILEPIVTIRHQKDIDRAHRILEKSEKACLISHSIKSQVTLKPSVVIHDAHLQAV